ncbi:undecaprenyl-diphosphatase [Chromatium okenii]|uniref:undecaprenyl-diphosphate phosphatase n=1 Tax=Chromatium okenii TaxID=61644 RepID=UPI001F5B0C30|nr:undecaprenyl-diphosphate phosphatase [Chromatium okenii]MBK1641649.1 undecaprenyl-diphosphatase [Chromatium okenii]
MDMILLLKALLLGVVEGLTEFLPISSTGHLIIVGSLLDYTDEHSKVFKIVIQFAAILAVCWFYRQRLVQVVSGLGHAGAERQFVGNILIAFAPALVLGVLFHHTIKTYLFNPFTVAAALIGGGLLILYIERQPRQPRFNTITDIGWREALKVGLAQTLAMVPGVSRAGATIMGGVVFGLSRSAATELSFFLAIPTMLAATVYDLYHARNLLTVADLPVFIVGFIAAFIAASLTVKILLRYVATHSFTVFAWYRIGFGVFVLVTAYTGLVNWN